MAMMANNIFLDIINGKIPADIVYRDDHCLAFRDISPVAPTHVLVIPIKEIRSHADIQDEDISLLGHLHKVAREVAQNDGLADYRLVLNCGEAAGQSVPHLHLHVIGGRDMKWPPG